MRLLVVEDDPKIRRFLKKSLDDEFYAVDIAEDGETGSRLANINEYDAIILDNMLPHKTGLEICRELREKRKSTPILILSVRSETDMKVRALNAGADDYLTKPFSLEELIARLRALLRRPLQVTDEILTAHSFALDIKRRIVKHGDTEIVLTRKEFMLLEYLMQNKGYVVSRAMIMEHVWDMYADPFSNTIESHVLSLRRKLKVASEEKIVETIPGRGYRIS